jgi:hypothetical protein
LSNESSVGLAVSVSTAVCLHQQQQPAASAKDDGGGAAGFTFDDGGLPGWQQAAVRLIGCN